MLKIGSIFGKTAVICSLNPWGWVDWKTRTGEVIDWYSRLNPWGWVDWNIRQRKGLTRKEVSTREVEWIEIRTVLCSSGCCPSQPAGRVDWNRKKWTRQTRYGSLNPQGLSGLKGIVISNGMVDFVSQPARPSGFKAPSSNRSLCTKGSGLSWLFMPGWTKCGIPSEKCADRYIWTDICIFKLQQTSSFRCGRKEWSVCGSEKTAI